jgi:hypothetical protein
MNPYGALTGRPGAASSRGRRTCQVRRRQRFARPSLHGNMSVGSRSCRHPPRSTKTSGLNSRPSRTPARTLPPARTLLLSVSASPSPGRPTRSLPPPNVDSHAPAACLGDFARPPRALHVASSPCQEVTASTAACRARPRETVASAQFARGHRVQWLLDHFDGRWTCKWRARHVRSDKTAKVGPVGAHPLSRGTTRTLAGSVLE